MAGTAKSVYVSIVKQSDHRTVQTKTCLNAKAAREFIESIKEKFPKPEYYYHTDTY